jgi:hypothetical protein
VQTAASRRDHNRKCFSRKESIRNGAESLMETEEDWI